MITSNFEKVLEDFIALPCWVSIAGESSGSMVSLFFGPMIARDKALENLKLPEAYRFNRSDHSIFIQLSSWMLEQGDKEICSCDSDNSNTGEMVMGLSKLLGLHVHHIEYIAQQGLYIDFQGDFTLSIFFDAKETHGKDSNNVTIFYPEVNYTINADMKLEFE